MHLHSKKLLYTLVVFTLIACTGEKVKNLRGSQQQNANIDDLDQIAKENKNGKNQEDIAKEESLLPSEKYSSCEDLGDLKQYVENCAGCHGSLAQGSSFAPSLAKETSLEKFESAIREGVGIMPGFAELKFSASDIKDAHYVSTKLCVQKKGSAASTAYLSSFRCNEKTQTGSSQVEQYWLLNGMQYSSALNLLAGTDKDWNAQLPSSLNKPYTKQESSIILAPLLERLMKIATEASETITQKVKNQEIDTLPNFASDYPQCLQNGSPPSVCLTSFSRDFAFRAFRNEPSTNELVALMGANTKGMFQIKDFDELQAFLRNVLVSPNFLFRILIPKENKSTLSSIKLAEIISLTILNKLPSESLWEMARKNGLNSREAVFSEVSKILRTPEARPFVKRLLLRWLDLEGVDELIKSQEAFPDFNPTVAVSANRSLDLFLDYILIEKNGSLSELMLSDTVYVDKNLEALYNLSSTEEGPAGNDFVLRKLPDTRKGILNQVAFLMKHSTSSLSHPLRRGAVAYTKVLCQKLGSFEPIQIAFDTDNGQSRRENAEAATSDPNCQSCHAKLNPIGFAFDSFDALGRHRTELAGITINTKGEISDFLGKKISFSNSHQFIKFGLESEAIQQCFASKTLEYIKGKPSTRDDNCSIDSKAEAYIQSKVSDSIFEIISHIFSTDSVLMQIPPN